jgi:hypothetical protein
MMRELKKDRIMQNFISGVREKLYFGCLDIAVAYQLGMSDFYKERLCEIIDEELNSELIKFQDRLTKLK